MRARKVILGKDYPEFCEWWRQWGLKESDKAKAWKYIPVRKLPSTGIIIEDDAHKYCAGFIHECEGNWIIFEWIVTNPKIPSKKRIQALELLLLKAKEIAKATGREIFSSIGTPGLIRLFEKCGFHRTDTNMTNMVFRG